MESVLDVNIALLTMLNYFGCGEQKGEGRSSFLDAVLTASLATPHTLIFNPAVEEHVMFNSME